MSHSGGTVAYKRLTKAVKATLMRFLWNNWEFNWELARDYSCYVMEINQAMFCLYPEIPRSRQN